MLGARKKEVFCSGGYQWLATGTAPRRARETDRAPCPGLRSLDVHRARQASRRAGVAKAMDEMLKRWNAFTCFLADGRICLSNNAAEHALRGIALGRKARPFAGSGRGGERAAIMIPSSSLPSSMMLIRKLARRCARQNCRSPKHQSCRATPIELEELTGHHATHAAAALPAALTGWLRCSAFRWPMTGSTAEQRRNRSLMLSMTRRRWPEMKNLNFCVSSALWPRSATMCLTVAPICFSISTALALWQNVEANFR
jgi:hypothetical protein